ncbi:MAG: di-heme oxidoredictase family protein [Sandaracinaceae bacterium]
MRSAVCMLWVLAGAGLTGCPSPAEVPDDVFGAQGDIVPYATAEQRETFARGRDVSTRQFTLEDGLGPHFNLSSCSGCHERPVFGGSGPRYRDFLLIQNRQPDGVQMPTGVSGVQPQFDVTGSRFPTPEDTAVSARRNAIPFFGVGLIAEIPGEVIEANADPMDADGDGVSGEVNYDQGFAGRLGRKSQTVSVEGFIRGPLFNHLGITSDPLSQELKARLPVPSASDTAGTRAPLVEGDVGAVRMHQAAAPDSPITDEDGIPDPELSPDDLFDLVSFAMLLAAPEPDAPTAETEAGHALFDEVGCVDCHMSLESPRGSIPLYSDLLVHDMGPALADGIVMGTADGQEFRTQPLWGLASTGPYLHDGRADTIEEAIQAHAGEGSEAKTSADAFNALPDVDQARVVAFLRSLGGESQATPGLLPPNAPMPAAGEYGAPLATADADRFEAGRAIFDTDMLRAEGLGPLFNGDSCRACHFLPTIGGGGPIDVNVTRQVVVDGDEITVPGAGTITHRFARDPVRPDVDPMANRFELRQTPPLFGLGLIDRLSEEAIVANADPEDEDTDGISGRAHRLGDDRLGRLGWKADVPSLAEFSRDAMSVELGATLPDQPGLTFGRATDDDGIADPEVTVQHLEDLTFFMASLGPPPRTRNDMEEEDAGQALFETIGCTGCHMNLALDDGTMVPLYSDLLLHDVAPEDYVGVPSGDAGPREFRTTPLWGLATSGPYMHDGRAGTIEDAVARHFGESSTSVEAFGALSADERASVLAFLRSL